ncbi:MAG: phage head closure protein, partial [Rubrivivax sp.]
RQPARPLPRLDDVMQIGTLDRRVLIEQNTPSRDPAFGSAVAAWPTLATVWARVDETLDTKLGGAEKVENANRVLTRQFRVTIRYRSDVTTGMRIRQPDRSNRVLQIVAIAEVGRRQALELMCEAYSA